MRCLLHAVQNFPSSEVTVIVSVVAMKMLLCHQSRKMISLGTVYDVFGGEVWGYYQVGFDDTQAYCVNFRDSKSYSPVVQNWDFFSEFPGLFNLALG